MNFKVKVIAAALTASLCIPIVFTGCKNGKNDAHTDDGQNGVLSEAYLDENTSEAILSSADIADFFGTDDEIFALFRNDDINVLAVKADVKLEDAVDLNLGLSASKEPLAMRVDAEVSDIPYILGRKTFDGSLYMDEKEISLASDFLFGKKAYGIVYEDAESLKNKFLESNLASILGIDGEEELDEMLEKSGSDFTYIANVIQAFKAFYADVTDGFDEDSANKLLDFIDGLDTVIKSEKYTVNETEYDTFALEITAGSDDFAKLGYLLVDIVEENGSSFEDLYNAVVPGTGTCEGTVNFSEAYDSIRESIDADRENVNVSLVSKIRLDKETGKILSLDIDYKEYSHSRSAFDASVIFSENGFEYSAVSAYHQDATEKFAGINDETKWFGSIANTSDASVYSIVWEHESDSTSNGFYNYSQKSTEKYGFAVDKENGTYRLFAEDKGEHTLYDGNTDDYMYGLSLEGNMEYSESKFAFDIDRIIVDGKEYGKAFEVSVSAEAGTCVDQHENVKSIFDISTFDIARIIGKIIKK